MGTLVVAQFVTLDGVTQAPGGVEEDREGGFAHGGWTAPYAHPQVTEQIVDSITAAASFLLGRRTYDLFAAHWPKTTEGPVAEVLNGLPKYVATRNGTDAAWAGTTVLTDDLPDEIDRLKRRTDGEIQVHGSADLIQTLIEHDLVDEYRLWVFPLVLGIGKRLFGAGAMPAALKLTAAATSPTGVAMHTYRRCGDLDRGAFGIN